MEWLIRDEAAKIYQVNPVWQILSAAAVLRPLDTGSKRHGAFFISLIFCSDDVQNSRPLGLRAEKLQTAAVTMWQKSLWPKRSLAVMVALLLWRISGVFSALHGEAVSVQLNIARTKREHPFPGTPEDISLQLRYRSPLFTWCQRSCMWSSSAIDLTVEGLPKRRVCTWACTCVCTCAWFHPSMSVWRFLWSATCPLDLKAELFGLAFAGQNAGHGLPLWS